METRNPTPSEIAWTKRMWGHLKLGGLWSYKDTPIAIRKDSETEALVLAFKYDAEAIALLTSTLNSCGITATMANRGNGGDYEW